MTDAFNPNLDLAIRRVIKAPRSAVWNAWANPESFAKWWIPEPIVCEVVAMDLRPGGAFVTRMSQDGGPFTPHLDACFLDVAEGERIVFTTALSGGWRPVEEAFIVMTAIITMTDHVDGTEYVSRAMHRTPAESTRHDEMGFQDGWGTAIGQLAKLVEN